jgi:hypothetical protein
MEVSVNETNVQDIAEVLHENGASEIKLIDKKSIDDESIDNELIENELIEN